MADSPILIVDDDPDIRESLGDLLVSEGYRVDAVAQGSDAVQHLKGRQYSAAVLDMGLPDLDGLSVLRVMMELDPHLPVIVLTGDATTDNRITSLVRGAFAHLTKPYHTHELKAILKRAVEVKDLATRAEDVQDVLHASENRFRALVESATDAIVLADHRGYIIGWNSAAERVFGRSKHEAIGHALISLLPERFRQGPRDGFASLTPSSLPTLVGKTVELIGLTRAGQEFPLELSLGSWKTKDGMFYSAILRDISARKRAEQELARLHRHNELILTSAAEGLCGIDLGGRVTFVNPAAARMLHANAADLVGQSLHGTVHHSSLDECPYPESACSICHSLTDGATHHIDNEVFSRADGSSFPVQYVSSPIREQDTVVGAVVVFQDISERKRGERLQHTQLAVSLALTAPTTPEAVTDQILGTIGEAAEADVVALWRMDQARSVLRCEGVWQASSAPMEEFVALCRRTTFPPGVGLPGRVWSSREPAWIADVAADANFPRSPTAVRVGLRSACAVPIRVGSQMHGVLEWHSRAKRDPDQVLLEVMADTGMKIGQFLERRQADLALDQAYKRTESILTGLPAAVIMCDERDRVTYANPLAKELFEQSEHPLAGQDIRHVLPLDESAIERFRRELTGSSTIPSRDAEFESLKRVFRYRLFPVSADRPGPPLIGMVVWDVTEEKQLQDQLIQSEKLSGLGTMVSGMAHEINNPAQAILSMAELILEEDNPATIKEFAADIVDYARHVATVVRDFASYARTAGREGGTDVHLNERLTEAVKMVRRGPHFGYIEVVTDFGAIPPIRARKPEIDQVLVNLIGNAAQAMHGQGRLTLSTRVESPWVTLQVADTGCGIPKSLLSKIFDPFFTTKEPGKGTGLGLSIVHRIVTKYAGTLSVESEEGTGTTFILRFPIEHAE